MGRYFGSNFDFFKVVWNCGLKKTKFNVHKPKTISICPKLTLIYPKATPRYYTDSDVFLADSVDLPDISDFFADILTFFHDGWEN